MSMYYEALRTNSDVFQVLTVTPEEGKPVEVNTALHRESLQLPEESLTEVKRHLSPEDLVPQQDPQARDVRTVTGDVDNLRAVALLLVTLHRQSLQATPHYGEEALDVLEFHGDQV